APILVIERLLSASPPLSLLLEQAGIHNHLIVLPDADSATRYLEEVGTNADCQENPLPVLALWDVTLPNHYAPETGPWLTMPQQRHLVIADLRGEGLHRQFGSAVDFGSNGVLVKFSSSETLLAAFRKLSRALHEGNMPDFSIALRAA
ncbi:MAG TPA: hypothetical protein VG754_05955, partial [Verrucomicrobiae bacterium]|nr:hypothetical protein [Verrucomicrobiae bacterium]